MYGETLGLIKFRSTQHFQVFDYFSASSVQLLHLLLAFEQRIFRYLIFPSSLDLPVREE